MRILFLFLSTLQLASGQVILQNAKLSNVSLGQSAASGGGSSTTFVTGQTLGSLNNNFDLELGTEVTVGAANVVVTQLGRWVVSGNSGTHSLRIRNSSGTLLGSVSVNTSGATSGQFLYGTLGSPITLTASGVYYIFSLEVNGGDQWYSGADTTISTTAVGIVNQYGYYDGTIHTGGGLGSCWCPVSFKYSSP